jgi:hypothetical protein
MSKALPSPTLFSGFMRTLISHTVEAKIQGQADESYGSKIMGTVISQPHGYVRRKPVMGFQDSCLQKHSPGLVKSRNNSGTSLRAWNIVFTQALSYSADRDGRFEDVV